MIKKIVLMLTVISLAVVGLTACGGNNKNDKNSTDNTPSSESTKK